MSLLFQSPALFGLLALGALPVLVHLLSRAKPPAYRFSDTEFLRRVMRRTARIRRPRDLLLLALRTLALIALAAAFISPFLISKSAPLPGEKRSLILLIDRSASMAAREGAGSRFETAAAEAVRYLENSRPDTANVIWIDASPTAVFPEAGPNLTFLTDVINQAEPLPQAGALGPAFDLALRQLATADGRRELVILSDFQASAWREFTPAIPDNVTVHTRAVAAGAPPNLAVTRLLAQPARPIAGQEVTVLVSVKNFSETAVRTQLTLDADGSRQTQPVELPAWGEVESAFTVRAASAGPLPLAAQLESDAFPADDSRHAILRVRDSIRMDIAGDPKSADAGIFDQLAAALPWLEMTGSSAAADLRFAASWDGADPDLLRESATAGTPLIVRPSATCPASALHRLLGLPATDAPPFPLDRNATGWAVFPDESHPANQLFRSGDFGNPFAGSFRQRLRLPASLSENPAAKPIARFADGVPAIIEFPAGAASILLWNIPLDPAQTDWTRQGAFLPSIAEIILRTRPLQRAESDTLPPGSPLIFESDDPSHAGSLALVGPSSQNLELTSISTGEGTRWQAGDAGPGIYRWQISGRSVEFAAVGFPESESDLRPLAAPPAIGKVIASGDSLARQAALARGLALWPWLAAAAIAFLTLESLMHLRQPSSIPT